MAGLSFLVGLGAGGCLANLERAASKADSLSSQLRVRAVSTNLLYCSCEELFSSFCLVRSFVIFTLAICFIPLKIKQRGLICFFNRGFWGFSYDESLTIRSFYLPIQMKKV